MKSSRNKACRTMQAVRTKNWISPTLGLNQPLYLKNDVSSYKNK